MALSGGWWCGFFPLLVKLLLITWLRWAGQISVALAFFFNRLYFRTVLDLQKNWADSTELNQPYPTISCIIFILHYYNTFVTISEPMPWLVWLNGLSTSLLTTGSLVWFPVRVPAWVAGQIPSWGCARGNQSMYLAYRCFSPSLSPFSSL